MGVQRGVLGGQEGGTVGGQDRRSGQVVVAEGKKNGALYFTPILTHNTQSRCQTILFYYRCWITDNIDQTLLFSFADQCFTRHGPNAFCV